MMALRKGEDIQKLSCSYFNVEFRRYEESKKTQLRRKLRKGFKEGVVIC